MPQGRRPARCTPADVVLGTVPDEHLADVARLMQEDPAFRAEVDRLREAGDALTVLPAASTDPPPPLDLDAALAARPAGRSGRIRAPRPAAGRVRRTGAGPVRPLTRPVLAATLAVLLFGGGLLAGTALDGGSSQDAPAAPAVTRAPAGKQVALGAFRGRGSQRAAVLMPTSTGQEMELRVSDARPSAPGTYYELWLLDDRRTTPIGTFRVGADGTARVRFPLAVDPARYRYLDVSVEDDDGDPGHSGRSVLRSAALT